MTEPSPHDRVLIPFGLGGHVEAEVEYVYGPPTLRHVLVILSPDISNGVVAEPTTMSVPIASVRQVEAA